MIQNTVRGLDKFKGLGQGSDDLFDRVRMEKLAKILRDSVVARTRRGLGSDDVPMKALSVKTSAVKVKGKIVRIRPGYAGWKAKKGLNPFRDLWGTGQQGGHMLDNLTVRQVTPNSARIALTALHQREKALANEQRDPWLGCSPSNVQDAVKAVREMFRSAVRAGASNLPALLRKLRGRRAA